MTWGGSRMSHLQTVICIKWGTAFPAEYVNRLYASVMKNVSRPTRFVLLTDDATGIVSGVQIQPIPDINLPPQGMRGGPWRKLALWSAELALEGDLLFLDLDVVITGSIDRLFDYEPGKFCIIRNWTQKDDNIGNSSVMRFRAGSAPHLIPDFEKDAVKLSYEYKNEQIYVSRNSSLHKNYWPDGWCTSFKHELLPSWPKRYWADVPFPEKSSIAVFTGNPRPHDAANGVWPEKKVFKKIYKFVRPVKWLNTVWVS
jgi:hypothetical protein